MSTQREHLDRMGFGDGVGSAAPGRESWPAVRDTVQEALDDPGRAERSFEGFVGPTTFAESVDTFY